MDSLDNLRLLIVDLKSSINGLAEDLADYRHRENTENVTNNKTKGYGDIDETRNTG